MLFSFRSSSLNLHTLLIPLLSPTLTSEGGNSIPHREFLHAEPVGLLTKQTQGPESLTGRKTVALMTCATLVAVIALTP